MLLGTDPEFFIVDQNNRPVPAWRVAPLQKNAIKAQSGQVLLYRDGYVLETGTVSAYSCRGSLGSYVYAALAEFENDVLTPKGLHLHTAASMDIDMLDMLKDVPKDAMVFGCRPSLNAYTGQQEAPPIDAMAKPTRFAGGHMHVGTVGRTSTYGLQPTPTATDYFKDFETAAQLVKLIDLFLGVPLAYIFDEPDEFARRKFYGKAGEYRFRTVKSKDTYNYTTHKYEDTESPVLEYRTPSNRMWNYRPVWSWAYVNFRNIASNPDTLMKFYDTAMDDDIQDAINNGVTKSLQRKLLIDMPVNIGHNKMLLDAMKNSKFVHELTSVREWQNKMYVDEFSHHAQKVYPDCHSGIGAWIREAQELAGLKPVTAPGSTRSTGTAIKDLIAPDWAKADAKLQFVE